MCALLNSADWIRLLLPAWKTMSWRSYSQGLLWSASNLFMNDDRFSQHCKLAPSSKADIAFIQHMIYHLAENGTMAVVLSCGVLFRGAAESHIRISDPREELPRRSDRTTSKSLKGLIIINL